MCLEVRSLTRRFSGLVAVAAVSFRIEPAEILGIIGPNGSGKTTLLNMIGGFLEPTEGTIVWKGREIQGQRPDAIASAGIVKTFQTPQLFGELTVLDNMHVATHLRLKRTLGIRRALELVGRARAADAAATEIRSILALCNLASAAGAFAGNLSYGEEKMLGIAMALLCGPELLLLDEPASGLGQEEIRNLRAVLEKVHARGTMLCIVDHKVGFLRGLAQRIIALNHGQKIAEGTPEWVLGEPVVVQAYLGRSHARG